MNHQFTMSNSALLQRVSRGEARQTYEMAVMRPNLAGASFEGNQGNLKVENSGTVNLQVAGELREALHEPVTRIQHLRAGFAQLGQKGPRLLCLRRPGGGGRMVTTAQNSAAQKAGIAQPFGLTQAFSTAR
jgi:hypothetical protein